MEKIKNLSLRKTIALYMALALLGGFALGTYSMFAAEKVQDAVWWKYADQEQYENLLMDRETRDYIWSLPRPTADEMSRMDWHISEACDFFQTYGILVFSMASVMAAVSFFYRNKLRRPLAELTEASKRMEAQDLDYRISYENGDELGRLCGQFEAMRQALLEHNRRLWRAVEEQKTLRAAVAHDIRSPLAVLRGYQETMLEFLPQDGLDKAALLEMLQEGMEQIDALERFVETMRRLSSLEEREPRRQEREFATMKKRLEQTLFAMEKATGKRASLQYEVFLEKGRFDEDMILEAAENLLSNAFSYAKSAIRVTLQVRGGKLTVEIADDGCGFLAKTDEVTRIGYRANPQDDLEHFGLGMYISRLYCEKHGGRLLTGNGEKGGAVVKAVFAIE